MIGSGWEGTVTRSVLVMGGGHGYVRVRWDRTGTESVVDAPAYDLVELREPTIAELTEMAYVAAGAAWRDARDGNRNVAEELLSEWSHQYELGARTVKAEFAHHLAVLDRSDRGHVAQRWWRLYARLATGVRFPLQSTRRS